MSYLLAKIVFLLFLAAVLGAWLAWWALRRRYEDVTVEYTSWQREWAGWRKALDEKLAHPPVTDLEPVMARLRGLETDVRGIVIPAPKEPDFSAVLARLGGLESRVSGIRIPEPTPAIDLAPVAVRIEAVERAVAAIRIPSAPAPVDLGPLHLRVDEVETAVKGISIPVPKEPDLSPVLSRLGGIESRLAAFKLPDPAPAVDLAPLQAELASVEQAVAAIRIPQPAPPTDLGPVQMRLGEVEKAIRGIVIPPAPQPREPDFSAILTRLGGMETRLGAFKLPDPAPAVDLAPVQARLDAMERAVSAIRIPPAAAPVDLVPLQARIAGVEAAVKGIAIPVPKEPDLSAIVARLGAFDARLGALRPPEAAPPVDLGPLQSRMADLERAVKGISFPAPKEPDLSAVLNRFGALETRLNAIRMPEPAAPVDLAPLRSRLEALEQAVTRIRIPEPQPTDLSRVEAQLEGLERKLGAPPPGVDLRPTHERMAALEAALRGIVIPPATRIDLGPVLERLGALDARLAEVARAPAARAPRPAPVAKAVPAAQAAAPAIPPDLVRSGSRNLLARAAFGPADDLKLIKGVAGVLEKMLHGIGVYYFWQIAEWTTKDIDYVDTQLTAFKGRIRRDEWKSQAVAFARRPESARKPRG